MEAATPVLYGYWRSGASWRLRIALNLKKIEYKYEAINLVKGEQKSEEFMKKNPTGLVPVLEIDGHMLTESMAIMEYLEETRTEGHKLLPEGALQRAQVRRMCEQINAGTQPIQNLGILKQVEAFGGDKVAWAK